MHNENPAQSSKKCDLVITCVFDAPLEIVWRAWVEPEIVKQMMKMSQMGMEQCLDRMAASFAKA
jgi:hypothetical protein